MSYVVDLDGDRKLSNAYIGAFKFVNSESPLSRIMSVFSPRMVPPGKNGGGLFTIYRR